MSAHLFVASVPLNASTYPHLNTRHGRQFAKLIQHLRIAFRLIPMCDDLKRDFYSACPVWYWPVLWWQFVLMERYLADLYAATGKAHMEYGLALGSRGALRLVFLSDAARRYARHGRMPAVACHGAHPLNLDTPPADYLCRQTGEGEGSWHSLPIRAIARSPQLYLDPG